MLIKVVIILIICYFIECGVIHDEDGSKERKSVHHHVHHFTKKKCEVNRHSNKLEEIEKQSEAARACLEKPLPHHYTTDDYDVEIHQNCFDRRKQSIECLKEFVDFVTPCFPEDEAFIPKFILEAYKGYSKYLCQHIEVLTFSGLLRTNLIKCLNKFMRHKEYNPQFVCYDMAKFANETDTTVVTKEDICKDLDIIYDCYEHQFKEHCPEAPKAWEFQAGLLNGVRAPCRNNTSAE